MLECGPWDPQLEGSQILEWAAEWRTQTHKSLSSARGPRRESWGHHGGRWRAGAMEGTESKQAVKSTVTRRAGASGQCPEGDLSSSWALWGHSRRQTSFDLLGGLSSRPRAVLERRSCLAPLGATRLATSGHQQTRVSAHQTDRPG